MVNYTEAMKKPFSDLKTLGIGSIIGAIPIVNMLISGYGAKTAEDVMGKKNKLRAWAVGDVMDYIIKLIMMIIIQIVYMIVFLQNFFVLQMLIRYLNYKTLNLKFPFRDQPIYR
jgi:hypothetical protein